MLLGMKQVSARVDEELLRQAKIKALETGVTMNEVIARILVLYVEGKIKVAKREEAPT
jgi:predicted HicB family RNase H-like nuclease